MSSLTQIRLEDLPQTLGFLDQGSVVIVGNGPSASHGDHGPRIDDFDHIVRINNYVTEGMENQVGSRTDIWVNGANQGLNKRRDIPEHIVVMIPPVVLRQKGDAIHRRIKHRLNTENYTLLPLELMTLMEQNSGIQRPTTGFFCIIFFASLGLDVTLHGFDFFVGSTAHYFDSPLKRWVKDKGLVKKATKHDVNGEKEFVEKLVNQGLVRFLGS